MKTLIAALALTCIASLSQTSLAYAQSASCAVQATDKKLAGAAKTSFLGKCERDSKASCAMQATEKKLNGAAKTSFTNKCVKDSVGT